MNLLMPTFAPNKSWPISAPPEIGTRCLPVTQNVLKLCSDILVLSQTPQIAVSSKQVHLHQIPVITFGVMVVLSRIKRLDRMCCLTPTQFAAREKAVQFVGFVQIFIICKVHRTFCSSDIMYCCVGSPSPHGVPNQTSACSYKSNSNQFISDSVCWSNSLGFIVKPKVYHQELYSGTSKLKQ